MKKSKNKRKGKRKKNSFFSDGLSVDESKVSVLILSYIFVCAVVMFLCITNKETIIAKDVFIAILVGVTGINISDKITKNAYEDNDDEEDNDENDYKDESEY